MAVASSSIDLTKPGFFISPIQTDTGNPNRMYWTDEQLEGLHGTNWIDFTTVPNSTPDGVAWDNLLDFANGGSGGQFTVNNSWTTLGIPGPGKFNEDNSSIEAASYLYFPAPGFYSLGVNSDDGFRLTFYRNAKDMLGVGLPELSFDGGRGVGNLQNVASVYISQAGYYGSRLIFFNGGGGSAPDIYSTSTPAGVTNVLVNDTNSPLSVLAFRASSGAPAYVKFSDPPLNYDQALANN